MQRDNLLASFCFPEENKFVFNNDYASVMQFITKNTAIPNLLASFINSKSDQENIQLLRDAIQQGNFESPIFSNSLCQLYALYLLKEKEITIEAFITVHIYLMLLIQCTDKQQLKEEDLNDKRITGIKLFNILDKEVGVLFKEKINKFILCDIERMTSHLAQIDRLVFGIEKDRIPDIFNRSLYELAAISPLFAFDGRYFYIPAAGLIKCFLKKINPEYSIQMAPIFGTITQQTLHKMHQKGFHPIPLYSCFVKNNLIKVHKDVHGQVPILIHDLLLHNFLVNVLPAQTVKFVTHYLIPHAMRILNPSTQELARQDFGSLNRLIDLDFTNYNYDVSEKVIILQALNIALSALKPVGKEKELITRLAIDRDHLKKDYQFAVGMPGKDTAKKNVPESKIYPMTHSVMHQPATNNETQQNESKTLNLSTP